MYTQEVFRGSDKEYEKYIENKIAYEDYEDDYDSIHIIKCPECGRKMIKYTESEEYQGQAVHYNHWQCPNGCDDLY